MQTKNQVRAQRAFKAVKERVEGKDAEDYRSFALKFPALLHSCGLVQSVAFANAKKDHYAKVLNDVQEVMGIDDLTQESQKASLTEYMRLSREALAAATWVKRYTEALIEPRKVNTGAPHARVPQ